MLCEEVLGNLGDEACRATLGAFTVDYVDLEWHEAFKKVWRTTTSGGRDVGVRLGEWVCTRGLSAGDVLGVEDAGDGTAVAVAVRLVPTRCLVVDVDPDKPQLLARVAWEVGNTHAPLFHGEGPFQLMCEHAAPLERALGGIPGVRVRAADAVLDPARRVSSSSHAHAHEG